MDSARIRVLTSYRLAYKKLPDSEKVKIIRSIMSYYDENGVEYSLPDLSSLMFVMRFISDNFGDSTIIKAVTGL